MSEIMEIQELLNLKEVLEWQISIAKCGSIIEDRKQQLTEVNKRIKKLQEHEEIIKNNAL
ncbi:hypothetical protein [Riemerella columbipharyngis]|nr:hypothetical protein [Riemerella columbipharyngis]